MEKTCVTWTKSLVRGTHANSLQIRHASLRRDFGKNPITVEIKVSPKRGSENCHYLNLDFVILQHVHIWTRVDFFDVRDEFRDCLPVEGVIPQDKNDRAVRNSFEDP